MAQPSGGTDLCGHSRHVFQGLSHRGAQRPTTSHCLCPGDNSNMSDPHHGQPRGAQDQERRWQLLKNLNLCLQSSRISCLWPTLPIVSQLGDNSLFPHTPLLCFHLNSDFAEDWILLYLCFPAPRNSEMSATEETYPGKWHWFRVNVIISGITITVAVQWQPPQCQQRLTVTRSTFLKILLTYCDKSLKTSSADLCIGHIQFCTHNSEIRAWFFLLENPVFRVMITRALELAKVKVKKKYLYWRSSLCWTAAVLMKDKVIFIAEFCIVFYRHLTLLWATY